MRFWREVCVINYVYSLISPRNFSIKYEEITYEKNLIVKPLYMAICHADQRYYRGERDARKLKAKLPMALIHEAMGKVVYDSSGKYKVGQNVVMIPNIPGKTKSDIIYENYQKGSGFMSSGIDGFMKEFVSIPQDRVVSVEGINFKVAAICELISVGVHAVSRFEKLSHQIKDRIGVWGDGSVAYILASILKEKFPESKIVVVGKNSFKLSPFVFADETYFSDDLPSDFEVDHAFECAGGDGSFYAIDDIINYINPQGTAILLGVTENKISINTRDILEKGLTFVGSSRSGVKDFEEAVRLLKIQKFQNRMRRIIYEDLAVTSIEDIHRVFKTDLNTPFKTVFKWGL